MPTFLVEYALSNRASCKGCKTKIDKEELRVGTVTAGPGDYDMTAWRHLACQKQPKGVVDCSTFVGFDSLKAEDKKKVQDWLASGGSAGKKRSAEELQSAAAMDPKKMKVKEMDAKLKESGIESGKSKKAKQEALDEVRERAAVEAKLSKLSVPQLKEMLEVNKQLKGGTKQEVLDRCVDGKLYGALPKCPDCGGGLLRVIYTQKYGHGGEGKYSCPGFFDDDAFRRCSYTSTSADRLPWEES